MQNKKKKNIIDPRQTWKNANKNLENRIARKNRISRKNSELMISWFLSLSFVQLALGYEFAE